MPREPSIVHSLAALRASKILPWRCVEPNFIRATLLDGVRQTRLPAPCRPIETLAAYDSR